MPVYPGVSVRLTDAQLRAIVCADPSVTNCQLADALVAVESTIYTARWRLRRRGWRI